MDENGNQIREQGNVITSDIPEVLEANDAGYACIHDEV